LCDTESSFWKINLSIFFAVTGVGFIITFGDWIHGVVYLVIGIILLAFTIYYIIRNESKKNIFLYAIVMVLVTPVFWLLLTHQFLTFFFGWLQ
jgi:hypothetical protein